MSDVPSLVHAIKHFSELSNERKVESAQGSLTYMLKTPARQLMLKGDGIRLLIKLLHGSPNALIQARVPTLPSVPLLCLLRLLPTAASTVSTVPSVPAAGRNAVCVMSYCAPYCCACYCMHTQSLQL